MRVPRVIERPVEHVAAVRLPVAVRILQPPKVRDAPDHASRLIRVEADGDVEAVGEGGDLVESAVPLSVLKDLDRVPARPVGGSGIRILLRDRHPEPPSGVERQVHRFENVRLGRHELDLEPRREPERLLFVGRRLPGGGANILRKGIGR